MSVTVKGQTKAARNLNLEIGKIEGDINKGLKAALVFVLGKAIERAPHDLGVLRGSGFTSVDSKKTVGRVGFTAKYAPFVHEMPETNNFSTPDTGPKFLEKAIFQNTDTILQIIKKRAMR